MKEAIGNLWDYPADIRVITTNGSLSKTGKAIMGRGCALEAKNLFPDIDKILGGYIRVYGNVCCYLPEFQIITFPVKYNWWEKADIELIKRSAKILVGLANAHNLTNIVLPRVGCGSGKLDWKVVKRVIEPIFDDRFTVITNYKPEI